MSENLKSLEVVIWLMADDLWSQANIIAFDVDINILAEHWPVVFVSYQLTHFTHSKMSNKKIVIVMVDQLGINTLGNVEQVFKV